MGELQVGTCRRNSKVMFFEKRVDKGGIVYCTSFLLNGEFAKKHRGLTFKEQDGHENYFRIARRLVLEKVHDGLDPPRNERGKLLETSVAIPTPLDGRYCRGTAAFG